MSGARPALVLLACAAAALAFANSALGDGYAALWRTPIGPLTLRGWIDDIAMALFFFAVGLEVKREALRGALATPAARTLPVIAAAAGMAVPALVFLAVAGGDPALVRGWAVPAATDIAFALGVLALAGEGLPASLRAFLAALAVADDVGAVAIVAVGYTEAIVWAWLALAAGLAAGLAALNRAGVRAAWPYVGLAAAMVAATYGSGVHPTIAGAAAALAVPLGDRGRPGPLERLEHGLAPVIALAVLPAFALANAGVRLDAAPLLAPLPLAVAAGLFLGKQAGVLGAIRLADALGLAPRPEGAGWLQLWGVALLAGIGFTMSLFIAGLAFADPAAAGQARAGVLAGSLLSGVAGLAVLRLGGFRARRQRL